MTKYVLDTNVFIQAKNFYYQFGFCGGFWDWIVAGHNSGLFYSCKKVHAELTDADDKDEAKNWCKGMPPDFFLDDIQDAAVMTAYGTVMSWAHASTHYLAAAKAEFAREKEADAFILSLAKAHGYTIVTQEKPNPAKTSRIPLPDAAKAFNVPTIYIYDLLAKHAGSTFTLTV